MINTVNNLFTTFTERLRSVAWRGVFERTRSLYRFLIRICIVATGAVNRESAIVSYRLACFTWKMSKSSGPLFTSLYLKQCSTSLMRYYSGSLRCGERVMTGPYISLSKAGIPTIIPPHHRAQIKLHNERSHYLVRLYLSLFSLCRIVKLAKPISRSTFSTIQSPIEDIDRIKELCGELKQNFSKLQSLYLPWVREHYLDKGFRFIPSWKSLPNDEPIVFPVKPFTYVDDKTGQTVVRPYRESVGEVESYDRPQSCFFTSMKYEIAAFSLQLRIIHSFEGVFSPSCLWEPGYRIAPLDIPFATKIANQGLNKFESFLGPMWDELATSFGKAYLFQGRIAQSLEGAGKRRLFVIGNWFKQRLLAPVHDWGMSVLRRLPQDGTYEQSRPIEKLAKLQPAFVASFDLSAATDRWPVVFIHEMMSMFFGQTLASSIVSGCLDLNVCSIASLLHNKHKEKKKKKMRLLKPTASEVKLGLLRRAWDRVDLSKQKVKTDRARHHLVFVAGQPLGYYASWALFALSHHFLVWLAANRVNPNRTQPFRDYGILGDDVVIADMLVAKEYRHLLDDLQVKISDAKSIVSDTGALEFAKQFWVDKASCNLSPISAKAVLAGYSLSGIQQLAFKYNLPEKVCLKLNGAGYRVLGSMDCPRRLGKKSRRIQALSNKCLVGKTLGLEWWIGRGRPLSPYLKGLLVSRARESLRLKDLDIPPVGMYWSEGEATIAENTAIRNWMESWLQYVKWYALISVEPSPRLDDFFNAPIVATSWKRKDFSYQQVLKSWSLLYKLYDLGADKSPGWTPPCIMGGYPLLEEPCGVSEACDTSHNRYLSSHLVLTTSESEPLVIM